MRFKWKETQQLAGLFTLISSQLLIISFSTNLLAGVCFVFCPQRTLHTCFQYHLFLILFFMICDTIPANNLL